MSMLEALTPTSVCVTIVHRLAGEALALTDCLSLNCPRIREFVVSGSHFSCQTHSPMTDLAAPVLVLCADAASPLIRVLESTRAPHAEMQMPTCADSKADWKFSR